MTHIFICAIKIIGSPFAVITEEEAKKWVEQDPESHYYYEIKIKTL